MELGVLASLPSHDLATNVPDGPSLEERRWGSAKTTWQGQHKREKPGKRREIQRSLWFCAYVFASTWLAAGFQRKPLR